MAVKKRNLGKVVKELKGYKVRMMVTVKSNGKNSDLISHTGKFGVYAGRKKLVKDGFDSTDSALEYINTI